MRTRAALLVSSLAALLAARPATAQTTDVEANPWLVRVRGIVIAPHASSAPTGLGVKADATIEVDITRYFGKYVSAELIAATAGQEVTSTTGATTTSLGTVNHLPPTLLLQFHPVASGPVLPYVGAGVNWTTFYVKSGGLDALDLSNSFGWAAQGGFDFPISKRGVFNLDAKYIRIKTDVASAGTKLYELKINPWVIGAGFGYRF